MLQVIKAVRFTTGRTKTKKDYKPTLLTYAKQASALRGGTIDMACIFADAVEGVAILSRPGAAKYMMEKGILNK